MSLANKIGREPAYNLVKALLSFQANGEQSLIDIVHASPEIRASLSAEEIADACEPLSYIGCNDALIAETLARFDEMKVIDIA